jgi:uncharacterized protein YcfL
MRFTSVVLSTVLLAACSSPVEVPTIRAETPTTHGEA